MPTSLRGRLPKEANQAYRCTINIINQLHLGDQRAGDRNGLERGRVRGVWEKELWQRPSQDKLYLPERISHLRNGRPVSPKSILVGHHFASRSNDSDLPFQRVHPLQATAQV
jgi:hypothetical protein